MGKFETLRLGFHLSIIGSIDRVFDRAAESELNTFQMFSRNPRGWHSTKYAIGEVENFRIKLKRSGIWPVFVHTPYLLNLASPREDVYRKSVGVLKDELLVASELGIPFVVTHLGSHVGFGKKTGFERIVKAMRALTQVLLWVR
jgi:deoxyribonuclease-4